MAADDADQVHMQDIPKDIPRGDLTKGAQAAQLLQEAERLKVSI